MQQAATWNFNILSPQLRLRIPNGFFPCSPTKILHEFINISMRATCPSTISSPINYPKNVW